MASKKRNSFYDIGIAVPVEDLRFHNLMDKYIHAFERSSFLEALRKKWLEDSSWIWELR